MSQVENFSNVTDAHEPPDLSDIINATYMPGSEKDAWNRVPAPDLSEFIHNDDASPPPDLAAIAAQSVNAAHRYSPQRIIEARRNAARSSR